MNSSQSFCVEQSTDRWVQMLLFILQVCILGMRLTDLAHQRSRPLEVLRDMYEKNKWMLLMLLLLLCIFVVDVVFVVSDARYGTERKGTNHILHWKAMFSGHIQGLLFRERDENRLRMPQFFSPLLIIRRSICWSNNRRISSRRVSVFSANLIDTD